MKERMLTQPDPLSYDYEFILPFPGTKVVDVFYHEFTPKVPK